MKMTKLKYQFDYYKTSIRTYLKAYLFGLTLSTGIILATNDIFYNNVILKKGNLYEELKPKELFGRGAKYTFIKNQMEDVPTNIIYKEYIEERKRLIAVEEQLKHEQTNVKKVVEDVKQDKLHKVFNK